MHKFYPTQPFVRSKVTFFYGDDVKERKNPILIYEEFTFNERGQITFIEAWTNMDGPQLPKEKRDADNWPVDIYRLSALIPGLGNSEGRIDIHGKALKEAAKKNEDVAEFYENVHAFIPEVMMEVAERVRDHIIEVAKSTADDIVDKMKHSFIHSFNLAYTDKILDFRQFHS